MAFLPSSDRTEQLITGSVVPDDLPDGSARVARLLTALRSPTASTGGGEQKAVASIVASIAAAPVSLDTARRRRMLPQLLTAKAAAAAAVVLLAGTGAAAATGSLPDSAQSTVSRALSHVSVSVPNPEDHAIDHAIDHAEPASSAGDHGAAVGPDATGRAMKGLCTAWQARGKADTDRGNSGNSTAFSNLRRAAHDSDMLVKDYCAEVLAAAPAKAVEDGAGAGADDGSSGAGHGQSDESHGQSADHSARVETPNPGGVDTGTTASDGANDTGADHAAPAAGAGSDHSGEAHGSSAGSDHPAGSDHSTGRP